MLSQQHLVQPIIADAKSYVSTALLLLKDEQILLAHRTTTNFMDGCYAFIGGKCLQNETVIACGIREAQEEIGVSIRAEDMELVHVMQTLDHAPQMWVLFFFVVRSWKGIITNRESHKHQDLRWFPLRNLPHPLMPAHAQTLAAWKEGSFFSILK